MKKKIKNIIIAFILIPAILIGWIGRVADKQKDLWVEWLVLGVLLLAVLFIKSN